MQLILVPMVKQAYGWISQPRVNRTFDSLTGSVMILFGVKLGLKS